MTPRPRPLCAAVALAVALFSRTPGDVSASGTGAAISPAGGLGQGAATHGQGTDFALQAQSLYRAAACGESGALPKSLSPDVLAAHCALLAKDYAEYRVKWLDRAVPYLAGIVPPGLPPAVVYPFGGGDLVTALATFPDAEEFTTISLEPAGDVRQIDGVPPGDWSHALAASRATLQGLLAKAYNTSKNLRIARLPLPEEIVHTMAALVLFGYQPVSLRYFAIEPGGSLRYLDPDARGELATSDMELVFRKAGDPSAPTKTLRHVAANLGDAHLRQDPRLLKHLEAKGGVAAMTKAAIHLLASDDFSLLRGYLLAHMEWMISDDTGILPRHARAAGFVQEGHGVFAGPSRFGHLSPTDVADLRKLFTKQETLPFFAYGYPDASGKGDLIVTRRER
jgi:hypothetical protein